MDWFNKIKKFYDKGLWDKTQVAKAVEKGKITAAQYQEITGDVYNGNN